jgi:hypothetical protein
VHPTVDAAVEVALGSSLGEIGAADPHPPPMGDDMAVKLRRAIIAARFRSPCPEQATPQETRAVLAAWAAAVQKTCPHANACLTCPMFVTTAEFLPQHHTHRAQVIELITAAEARGQACLVEMNQQVLGIIDTLGDDPGTAERAVPDAG